MRHSRTLALSIALLVLPIAAWGHFQRASPNPLTDDPTSLYYHDFFDLPDSATTADSLQALRLPPAHGRDPRDPPGGEYVYFLGTIVEMEPISKARFPHCFEPGSDHPYMAYHGSAVVRIRMDSLLAGPDPGAIVEAVTKMARTPYTPQLRGWKSQLMQPGALIAGLLLRNMDPQLAGAANLHGSSIFVFSSPRDADRLDDFRDIIVDLYRRSGEAMQAARCN
jgi:hypothetical protein